MKKVISLVLVVALVASCFCLEAFAASSSISGCYSNRNWTASLSVSTYTMSSKMDINNPKIDGTVKIYTAGEYWIKDKTQNNKEIKKTFRTPVGLEAERSVEFFDVCVKWTKEIANARYYINGKAVGRINAVRP